MHEIWPVSSGWQCPVCKHVMSPSAAACMFCPAKTGTTGGGVFGPFTEVPPLQKGDPCQPSHEGGMCGCDEPDDGLVLRLPAHMAGEGTVRVAKVADEWSEVFPGLQCRLGSPGEITVTFRLTPEDGQQHD